MNWDISNTSLLFVTLVTVASVGCFTPGKYTVTIIPIGASSRQHQHQSAHQRLECTASSNRQDEHLNDRGLFSKTAGNIYDDEYENAMPQAMFGSAGGNGKLNRTVSQDPPIIDSDFVNDKRKANDMYSIILSNSARDFSSERRQGNGSLDSRLK